MIINGNKTIRKVSGLTEERKKEVCRWFLREKISTWYNNSKNEWFALKDLVGYQYSDWSGTPLEDIYKKHKALDKLEVISKKHKTQEEIEQHVRSAAAIDAGWLLKKAIQEDEQYFETRLMRTREYKRVAK